MLRQEWNTLLHKRFLLLIIVAILMIPTIYTTLFLGSMWDPYGNLSKLPIAVVNQDQTADYNGISLYIGSSVVRSLSENDSLDFHFVDEADASAKDGTGYAGDCRTICKFQRWTADSRRRHTPTKHPVSMTEQRH